MLIVLFRSKLVDAPDGYAEMAQEMLDAARGMPGFIDVKAFKADDGERLTVVWWQDEETLRAWRLHARHLVAQRLGRERWYEYYKIEVASVIRSRDFARAADRGAAIEHPPAAV
ncbi:MAG TPA: antibiotic biosynthesis monooxygenase [Vicinamibacterales bacterium]|jgi:heme-degrading monooxygenase HmoA|nr:antibiotic biosynthesis monooxygenase [Vicinamibacterales bacterium]